MGDPAEFRHVGMREWFMGPARAAALTLSVPTWQPQVGMWTRSDSLATVNPASWPIAELFALDQPAPMTRDEAMMVPAVSRSRHLICSTVSRLPLWAMRGADHIEPSPSWMSASDGQLGDLDDDTRLRLGLYVGQTVNRRMLDTVDDLLFFGWSLWLVTRFGAPDPDTGRRFPLRMAHIPYGSWDVNHDSEIIDADGQPFAAGAAILFQGFHDGVLTFGARTIRTAGRLETAAADRAEHPIRFELHQTTDVTLDKEERAELVAEARAALARNDGILFTNSALESKAHQQTGTSDAELVVGGRSAAAVDVARHMNMPAAMIDAATPGTSMEYATTETRNQQWLDYGLTAYMDPITARLSMDDVMPLGRYAAFDTSSLTTTLAPTTGPTLED